MRTISMPSGDIASNMEYSPMRDRRAGSRSLLATAALALVLAAASGSAAAAKIVCWKDSSGKVVGCGDKVPPEFQQSATKELDSRGITRGSTDSVEDAARKRAQEQEALRQKAEAERRASEQRRLDNALLETYSNEREIDLKRDRDLQVVDSQLQQLQAALRNAAARVAELQKKGAQNGNAGPAKEDFARAAAEKQRYEQAVEAKQKEKEAVRNRYADFRKRYAELKAAAK
jgi:hypothetical protein